MNNPNRQFAVDIVTSLTEAGFVAYWAGGCVRDMLAGKSPKDYDVATDAKPEEVRSLFGHRRTLPIGQAFGVITVLGPRGTAPIEVATFREDVGYTDGRHPDEVKFSHARADAQRRDFTINGLFFDPLEEVVVDFVNGQADFDRRIVRAIGNADERIDEDKLRMLRCVRFATVFRFSIEVATFEAVQRHATEIDVVSVERVATELEKMLIHPNSVLAVELLVDSRLWKSVFPEVGILAESHLEELKRGLQAGRIDSFAAFIALLSAITGSSNEDTNEPLRLGNAIARRLKLSNESLKTLQFCLKHWETLANGDQQPWSKLQPVLAAPFGESCLHVAESIAAAKSLSFDGIRHSQHRFSLPIEQLNPAPLLTGEDLIRAGLKPGPQFRVWLGEIRDGQLDGRLSTSEDAWHWLEEQGFLPNDTKPS